MESTEGTAATPASSAPAPAASKAAPAAARVTAGDAARVKANELGLVPVLMYHQLVADPGGNRYDLTPEQFTAELQTLYDDGYVPVTAAAYAKGTFDIPAGKHPVVLTFDDSTTSQFGLTSAGEVKPGTAVALLLEFAAAHPGFTPVATMYVNFSPPPFAGTDPVKGLRWLVARGFEIGNHTLSHANLRKAGAAGAQREIALDQEAIMRAVPGIAVTTIALPFGVHPRPDELAAAGSSDGITYRHAGVMEVGSNPARSPYNEKFDGSGIPRIRSQSIPGADAPYESKHWLEWLRAHPDQRYTSDGDPSTVAFPRLSKQKIAGQYQARALAY